METRRIGLPLATPLRQERREGQGKTLPSRLGSPRSWDLSNKLANARGPGGLDNLVRCKMQNAPPECCLRMPRLAEKLGILRSQRSGIGGQPVSRSTSNAFMSDCLLCKETRLHSCLRFHHVTAQNRYQPYPPVPKLKAKVEFPRTSRRHENTKLVVHLLQTNT